MNVLTDIFWWGAMPLQAVLLVFFVRNHFIKSFPAFFVYTCFSLLTGIGRLILTLTHTVKLYFFFYWSTEAIYALLGIAVLYEVYKAVFGNLKRASWFRAIFPVAVVGALALTFLHAPGLFSGPQSTLNVITASEMAVRMLQVGLFVILIGSVALFGLRWRQQAFGISAGYGIYASVCLLASTKLYEIGTNFEQVWGIATVLSYTIAGLIWVWFFSSKPEPPKRRADPPPLSARDLEQYRDAIQKVQKVRHI
ncbi:MAG TPA: hypothetical protein VGF44_17075 [Terriglobales bacterium]|jgi:hypothetical protein